MEIDSSETAGIPADGLGEEDRPLIRLLSLDLGGSAAPYAELAVQLGWSEERVIERIREFFDLGVIRRMAGVLVHQKSGYTANAMIVWKIEPSRLDEIGEAFGKLSFVSHCYFRPGVPGWPYNLYTMVHAHGSEELEEMVESMAVISGGAEREALASLKELKKSSLEYFPESEIKRGQRHAKKG